MVDVLELLHLLLGHPDGAVLADVGGRVVEVADVRYEAEREAVVLLLGGDLATTYGSDRDSARP
ncbi:hypothetical protein [Krasilnikovia sp. MM14-A1259]|uniref:hypothetical protein n=1 Tax=Krasilnikovia sp. MM14-A1259 TaxID=3373539 RepID=UPI003800A41D